MCHDRFNNKSKNNKNNRMIQLHIQLHEMDEHRNFCNQTVENLRNVR